MIWVDYPLSKSHSMEKEKRREEERRERGGGGGGRRRRKREKKVKKCQPMCDVKVCEWAHRWHERR